MDMKTSEQMPPAPEHLRIEAPVGNYYGKPYCTMTTTGPVMALEGECTTHEYVPVSLEFFAAWVKEFGDPEKYGPPK